MHRFVSGQMDKQFGENESNEIVISQRVSFPKRVFFIIGNEFCERFNFNGMRGEAAKKCCSIFINLFVNIFSHFGAVFEVQIGLY